MPLELGALQSIKETQNGIYCLNFLKNDNVFES